MSPIYQWRCEECGHSVERLIYGLQTAIPEIRRCVALLWDDESGDVDICPGDMRRITNPAELRFEGSGCVTADCDDSSIKDRRWDTQKAKEDNDA